MLSGLVAVFAFMPWSVPNNNITHITFPINIANATHEYTYALAQEFELKGQPGADIYTALLPQPDAGPGISVIRAVFESYLVAAGSAITVDDNCRSYDQGVNCAVDFDGTYENTYNVEVRNTEGTTWNGTVIDTVTKRRIHIGSFTLPVGTGTSPTFGQGMLVFDVQGGPPWPHCDEFPHSSVVFGVPTTMLVWVA